MSPSMRFMPEPAVSPLQWEETACPLCGHDGIPWLESADPQSDPRIALRFMLVRCGQCDLVFTNPRPTSSCLSRMFPKVEEAEIFPTPPRTAERLERTEVALRLLPPFGNRRLLCLGSQEERGWRERGWIVESQPFDEGWLDGGDVDLFAGGTRNSASATPADAVSLEGVLERADRPRELLMNLHERIVPGGRLVTRVANLDSWSFQLFGRYWRQLDLPRLRTHFTPATLRRLLQSAGFRVLRIEMSPFADDVLESARLASANGSTSLLHRWCQFAWVARGADWLACRARRGSSMVALAARDSP